ncbi:MAG: hypothetical protein ACMUIG_08110, partial [Thermoplasmatota archaeon]
MEEFRIEKNPKASAVIVGVLIFVCAVGLISPIFIGIYGIILVIGAILAFGVYGVILKGIMEKKSLVIDDKGLRYYWERNLTQEIEWENVSRIEIFDQAHNDF